jgi:hypothetical protein
VLERYRVVLITVDVLFSLFQISNNNQHQNILTFFTFYITSIIFYYYSNKKIHYNTKFFTFLYKFFLFYITSSLFTNFKTNNSLLYSVLFFTKQAHCYNITSVLDHFSFLNSVKALISRGFVLVIVNVLCCKEEHSLHVRILKTFFTCILTCPERTDRFDASRSIHCMHDSSKLLSTY